MMKETIAHENLTFSVSTSAYVTGLFTLMLMLILASDSMSIIVSFISPCSQVHASERTSSLRSLLCCFMDTIMLPDATTITATDSETNLRSEIR